MTSNKEVKIRFNTNYANENEKKWRLLIPDSDKISGYKEHLVDEVKIFCPCYTTTDNIENGTEKSHVTCIPNKVEIIDTGNCLIALIS